MWNSTKWDWGVSVPYMFWYSDYREEIDPIDESNSTFRTEKSDRSLYVCNCLIPEDGRWWGLRGRDCPRNPGIL